MRAISDWPTPVRLGVYGVALVVAFAATFAVARAAVPAQVVEDWQQRGEHGSTEGGHTDSDSTGESEGHSEEGAGGHSESGQQSDQRSGQQPGQHGGHGESGPVPGLAAAQDGYQLTGLSAPTSTGTAGVISLVITGPEGEPVTRFEVSHEKELHLIVVRTDGQQFRHVHPTRAADGTWSLPWSWAEAGSYRVYADFVPAGAEAGMTLTSTVEVAGEFSPAAPAGEVTEVTVDGYTVAVAGSLAAGQSSDLTFTITRDGKPVQTVQPYLGAFGHLVALRSGDLGYLHVHPTGAEPTSATQVSGPQISFAAEAPTAGRYLLYLDFQIDGQVRTAPLALTAN